MLCVRRGSLGLLTGALTVAIVLAACGSSLAAGGQSAPRQSQLLSTPPAQSSAELASAQSSDGLLLPPRLIDPSLDLRAGPVNVPLQLEIPSLRISTGVLGVGITSTNVMDTPKGSANDPVWQKVFWYRGSGIPGSASTATIAGHVDDDLGRPAIFAHLKDLRAGDSIVVRDMRSGLDVRFLVTETATYTLRQTLDPAVLAQIYGAGPVDGLGPQLSPDGLSHLTLITCTGHWINGWGTFDHRLVVYAVSAPLWFPARRPHS
jgi:sortase (surface protein transpeptidase)